jgi:hypothetical protein
MTTVTNAQSAEAARTRSGDKARADRKLIVDFIARMGIEGASDGDLERALVANGLVNANALRIRRAECEPRQLGDGPKVKRFALITCELGVTKQSGAGKRVTIYHVTARGLRALGWDEARHWHAEKKAEA